MANLLKIHQFLGSCSTQALGFHSLTLISEPTLGIIKCSVITIVTSLICVQLSVCHNATQKFRPNVPLYYIVLGVQRSLSTATMKQHTLTECNWKSIAAPSHMEQYMHYNNTITSTTTAVYSTCTMSNK